MSGQPVMHDFLVSKGAVCSTADVNEKERLEYWIDLVCAEFVQLDCVAERKRNFSGMIRGCGLEDIRISEVNADPQQVTRSRKQIAKSAESEFLLSLQLEEVGIVRQDGRIAELQAGDFALYDSTRPYQLHFSRPFRQLVLQIPHDSLAQRFARPGDITARRVPAQNAIGAMTSQFIRSVAGCLDRLSAQERRVITTHIVEFIALAMGARSSLRELDGQSIARTAMLERIKQYIEINIRQPQLAPAQIARRHHISERYQRLLFAATGTTISRYILNRRLELCREAMENSLLKDYSITQLAFSYGFNGAAHFSRCFKERYGASPREYRGRALTG